MELYGRSGSVRSCKGVIKRRDKTLKPRRRMGAIRSGRRGRRVGTLAVSGRVCGSPPVGNLPSFCGARGNDEVHKKITTLLEKKIRGTYSLALGAPKPP